MRARAQDSRSAVQRHGADHHVRQSIPKRGPGGASIRGDHDTASVAAYIVPGKSGSIARHLQEDSEVAGRVHPAGSVICGLVNMA